MAKQTLESRTDIEMALKKVTFKIEVLKESVQNEPVISDDFFDGLSLCLGELKDNVNEVVDALPCLTTRKER